MDLITHSQALRNFEEVFQPTYMDYSTSTRKPYGSYNKHLLFPFNDVSHKMSGSSDICVRLYLYFKAIREKDVNKYSRLEIGRLYKRLFDALPPFVEGFKHYEVLLKYFTYVPYKPVPPERSIVLFWDYNTMLLRAGVPAWIPEASRSRVSPLSHTESEVK